MNLKTKFAAILTATVLAMTPMAAFALVPTYTMVGNYIITGDLFVDGLLGNVGNCLEVGALGQIVPTGTACGGGGGGGVTSVTAGPSGNITVAPNTGATIVDEIEDPTYTGPVTGQYFVASFTGGIDFSGDGHFPLGWFNSSGQQMDMNASGALTVAGINNTSWGMYNLGSSTAVMAFDGTSLGLGGLNDSALTPGDCVQAAANGQLTSTGSACAAGGGVTSVTSVGSGNLIITPNTGAVTADITGSPTFPGTVTGNTFMGQLFDTLAVGTGSLTQAVRFGSILSGGYTNVEACPSGDCALNGVFGTALAVTSSTNPPLLALDPAGDLAVNGYLAPANLASSSGQCLQATTNGEIIATGSACGSGVAIQHGHQTIIPTPGSCVPGTAVTFSPAFTAAPDITMSTDPVVGDTGAPSGVTTAGFTPELCSSTSAASVIVYWTAVN